MHADHPLLRPAALSRLLPLLLAGLLPAAPAGAQQLFVGQVVEEASGRPVVAAFVAVHDEAGERLAAALTDPDGRFRLAAPTGAGPYTLRAERIGYGTAESEPLSPEAGRTAEVTLRLPTRAIVLEGIEAVGVRRCPVGADEGLRIHELWEEARKALEIAAWTDEEGIVRLRGRRYERLYPVATGRVEEERVREVEGGTGAVFQSAPASELVRQGYVRRVPGPETFDYFGPDARAVLSSDFLDAYCFRLVDRNPPDLTGLAFEPVESRGVPDITGVLWLDRETRALRHLEFQYTSHLLGLEVPGWLYPVFGGRIDFRELPGGAWIVDRWSLRMPEYQGRQLAVVRDWDPVLRAVQRMVEARSLRPDLRVEPAYEIPRRDRDVVVLLAVREEGGELVELETDAGTAVAREPAVLEGTVYDSTRAAPLEGARVELVGTDYAVETDAAGAYRLAEPTEGRFEVAVRHPRLDTLGASPLSAEIELARGEVRRLDLAVPSPATRYARLCGTEPGASGQAMVAGRVLDPLARTPVSGARMELRATGNPGALPRVAASEDDGTFLFCSVPAPAEYRVLARVHGVVDEVDTLAIAPGEVLELEVVPPLRREGVLRGVVREGEDGEPLARASVTIRGGDIHRLLVSDGEGRFQAADLPVGIYAVQVDHLGYRGVSRDVAIQGGGRVVNLEVQLLPQAIALEPMVVRVEGGGPAFGPLADVRDRRVRMERLGLGHFLDRREIEERATSRLSHLLSRIVGVRSQSIPGSPDVWITLNIRDCAPSFYVDGVRVHVPQDDLERKTFSIDERVSVSDAEAIEVYRRVSELPGEFWDVNSARCGAVAIWTRRGA